MLYNRYCSKINEILKNIVLTYAFYIIYFIEVSLYGINKCCVNERLLQIWNILDHTGIWMPHICVSNAWHGGIYTIRCCYQNIIIWYMSLKRHRWSFFTIILALRGQKATYKHWKKQFVKYTFETWNVPKDRGWYLVTRYAQLKIHHM